MDWEFITAEASSFLLSMAQKVRHTSMDIPTIKFNSSTPSSSPALRSRSAALIRQRSRSLCNLDEVHDQNNTPKRNKKCKFCHHYFLPFVRRHCSIFVFLLLLLLFVCLTVIIFCYLLLLYVWSRQCSLPFVGRVCGFCNNWGKTRSSFCRHPSFPSIAFVEGAELNEGMSRRGLRSFK